MVSERRLVGPLRPSDQLGEPAPRLRCSSGTKIRGPELGRLLRVPDL